MMNPLLRIMRSGARKVLDGLCRIRLSLPGNGYRCALCGKKPVRVFFPYWRRPVLECPSCGVRFAVGRISPELMRRLHSTGYWQEMDRHLHYPENPAAWEEWKQWKNTLLEQCGIAELERVCGDSRRVLDIGCGNGRLLELLGARGWQGTGIDFSPEIIPAEQPGDISFYANSYETVDVGSYSFELICLVHVLEHFCDPLICLRKVSGELTAHGRVFIEVPLTQNYYGEHHRWFFSEKSLQGLLAYAGFIIEHRIVYRDEVHAEAEHLNLVVYCRRKEASV